MRATKSKQAAAQQTKVVSEIYSEFVVAKEDLKSIKTQLNQIKVIKRDSDNAIRELGRKKTKKTSRTTTRKVAAKTPTVEKTAPSAVPRVPKRKA